MQPKITQRAEMKVVGLGTKFISILSPDKNNMTAIPQLWDRFVNQMNQIPHRTGEASYGLCEMLPPADKSHKDELFYTACVQVTDFDSIPAGMVHRIVPAGNYALFTHKGKLDGLGQTMKSIHAEWLPQSGLQYRRAPEIEIYDHRFSPGSDQSEFDILIPVK